MDNSDPEDFVQERYNDYEIFEIEELKISVSVKDTSTGAIIDKNNESNLADESGLVVTATDVCEMTFESDIILSGYEIEASNFVVTKMKGCKFNREEGIEIGYSIGKVNLSTAMIEIGNTRTLRITNEIDKCSTGSNKITFLQEKLN